LSSFVEWFLSKDWINVELWAMFGQWFSGMVTLVTVWFLWKQTQNSQKQTEASLKQTQLAIEQMEDARKREKEAMEVALDVRVVQKKYTDILSIFLTNTKSIPVLVNAMDIFHIPSFIPQNMPMGIFLIEDFPITSEFPKLVSIGSSVIEISMKSLIKEIEDKKETQGTFLVKFYIPNGTEYTVTIYLKSIDKELFTSWVAYATNKHILLTEDMESEKYNIGGCITPSKIST
jgi:hypothetical protein